MRAYQCFSLAIGARTADPRCYYFRGLTYLRLGRAQDADLDFQEAARLETGSLTRSYSVAKSLERIQGPDRAELERYRVEARMALLEKSERERRARGEENRREEQDYLKEQAKGAPSKPLDLPADRGTPAVSNPFDVSGAGKAPEVIKEQPAAEPIKAPARAAEAEKPAAVAKPAEAAKAAVEPAKPAEIEKPAATAKPSEDPFAAPANEPKAAAAKADENPFAAPAKAEKPAAKAADDPFATPAPDAKAAKDAKPAAKAAENPFAEEPDTKADKSAKKADKPAAAKDAK
jgi:hypothetical protein